MAAHYDIVRDDPFNRKQWRIGWLGESLWYLANRVDGQLTFATSLHDDDECPFRDGDVLDMVVSNLTLADIIGSTPEEGDR